MKQIKLTQGKYTLMDDEDFERVNKFKWCAAYINGMWYAIRNIKKVNGKHATQSMHRLIMNTPNGMDTDHRNHNGLDNRKCNLRVCTRSGNAMNRQPYKQTSSQYKGVTWDRASKKWMAQIRLNGERIHLGRHTNEITAALIYDIKAKELFGDFACLNFGSN